jgi:putative ribosome biogenesis GTPase RsgA
MNTQKIGLLLIIWIAYVFVWLSANNIKPFMLLNYIDLQQNPQQNRKIRKIQLNYE